MRAERRVDLYCTLYQALIRLYPPRHRDRFGSSMLQTFRDLCRDSGGSPPLGAFLDTFMGILNENLTEFNMKTLNLSPRSAALLGFLFCSPFIVLNAIVAKRIEPFFSMLRPGPHTSPLEYVLLFTALLLLPVGAWIALGPMFRRGQRRFYLWNGAAAAVLLVAFAVISTALGTHIYRCDVLQIPNCD